MKISKIIEFITRTLSKQSLKTAFRDYQYIKINAFFLLTSKINIYKIYLNLRYLIILNNRALFL